MESIEETKSVTIKSIPITLWLEFRSEVMKRGTSVPQEISRAIEMWLKKYKKTQAP